ncbi:hypothetical protein HYE67_005067 [Fusarium culmorum]|uniref:NACHT domain-containing protein n=1 Tax=Fusarium culmorum TaxID=5516 RepID=A0A7S8D6F6_FUSCU|nr:hypothetical protein HYE67_005067 [Fusarium culmorum]
MALVIRESGNLKPDIRLAQAVSEFEALLTSEQKSTFRTSRDRAVSTAPTMSDVMRLTAEIDLKATSKHGRGRCFGPRMTNTLQAIQQFAALGDIVVGGGQNLIACGVWAVARMALHVITGYFTYLESLSLLFMAIGRNAPRYQAMAALYPKSKRLQGFLCEYFTIITKLCHQSVLWTRKSAIGRFTSTINDPQMKTFKDDLEVWSSAIKEETNLLLNQQVVEEAKKNSIFRSLATFRSDASAHQRKIERSTRFLDKCSKHDYRTTWKQTRKCGTTSMLGDCQEYQQWKEGSKTTSILFLGKLGAGKSVLLANIVDDLNLKNNAVTLYFFARHDNEESMKPRTIFGCLIRQLLEHVMDDDSFSHLFTENIPRLDLDDTIDLFRLARPSEVSIVLDGLDECELEAQRTVLGHLGEIRRFGYRICLSVRTPEDSPLWKAKFFGLRVYIPEENPDISNFIEAEIHRRVEDGRLVTRDPDLVEEVKKELIAGACGMFLWATLQLDSICAEVSDHDIREAIQDLPRDLTETFRRNLSKASPQDSKRLHVRIFKFLVSARELLTAEQLRQAASVTIGQTIWNSDKEITSIHPVLKFCGSLVMVDEEDDTVRFIHHSARSFCLDGTTSVTDWSFTQLEADQHMAETLVTYLSCNAFETRLSKAVAPKINAKEMPKIVAMNALGAHPMGTGVASRLLRSKSKLKRDIGPALAKASANRSQGDHFPFLAYAKRHWVQHTSHLEDIPSLPHWHTLLDHPSFGIDNNNLPVRIFIPDTFLLSVDRLLGQAEASKMRNIWRRPTMTKPISSFVPPQWANMIWALSSGHIMLLKHELTKSRGAQRIKAYVKLWSLLRRVSIHAPSVLQIDMNYNMARWLSRMFVNLAMDHPAKIWILVRIPESDSLHTELILRAIENSDILSIRALIRYDELYEMNIPIMDWYDKDTGTRHEADVPKIIQAALSMPPDKRLMELIIQGNDRWFIQLLQWFCFMNLSNFQLSVGQDPPLSFRRAFDSLKQVGVSEKRIEILEELLDIARGSLVEIQGMEIPKVTELE